MKTKTACLLFVLWSFSALCAFTQEEPGSGIEQLVIKTPSLSLTDVPFAVTVRALDTDGEVVKSFSDSVEIDGISIKSESGDISSPTAIRLQAGEWRTSNAIITTAGRHSISMQTVTQRATAGIRIIPGWLSLLPPLIAIALAFITRQVLIALFCGVWLGALFVYDYNIFVGFMKTVDHYLVNSLADTDHAAILIFSLTLGGMVGVISKAGGTQGIVEKLSQYANSPRGGQLATWAMGILIFFDDYANTLVVGNTMRPFTDRLRISREKLSYIVDSTAAPIASVALVSTWIGFQIGLIDDAFKSIGLSQNAYSVFLQSIPYQTYSIFALIFVFMIAVTLRDFGPMWRAEKRALETGKVLRDGAQPIADSTALEIAADESTPLRWYNALIPILVVIAVTLLGLYFTGRSALGEDIETATLGTIFGAADSFAVLMWAAFLGLFTAAILALMQRLLPLRDIIDAAISGYKSMMMAAMILILAWAIGAICQDLRTADYVIALTREILSPHFIPFATFAVAAFISFSTGSSWTTMTILTPIVIPIAYKLPADAMMSASLSTEILLSTVGAILSGSVLGDHCSPISDTTILSSMASAADHVDHVRTQMPYALIVGGVAIFTGYLPNGYGINTYICMAFGLAVLMAIVFLLGKTIAGREKMTV